MDKSKNLITLLLILVATQAKAQFGLDYVETARELVAIDVDFDDDHIIALKGVGSATDGLGGLFVYDSTSLVATNTADVFKPRYSDGRWERLPIPTSAGGIGGPFSDGSIFFSTSSTLTEDAGVFYYDNANNRVYTPQLYLNSNFYSDNGVSFSSRNNADTADTEWLSFGYNSGTLFEELKLMNQELNGNIIMTTSSGSIYVEANSDLFLRTQQSDRITIEQDGDIQIHSLTASQFVKTDANGYLVSSPTIDLSSEVSGTLAESYIDSTIARDSELHSAVTVSGAYDYITLSGQDLIRGQVDLSTDVTGVLADGNIPSTIARDSELHDAVTLGVSSNAALTLSGQELTLNDINLATEVVGTLASVHIDSTIARDSELHDAVTVSGIYDYITLSGQDIVRGQVDLSTDVTGVLADGNIPAAIARDSELHDAVTVSGTYDYITLSGQDIVRGQVDLDTDVTGDLDESGLQITSGTSGTGKFLESDGSGGFKWSTVSGSGTVTSVAVTGDTSVSVSGSPITTAGTIALDVDSDLDALAANTTNGLWARTGAGTGAAREIAVGSSKIAVTNGNGVSGDPTIDLGTVNLADLDNVVLTSPSSGEVLEYNGSNWVNAIDDTGSGGDPAGEYTVTNYTVEDDGTVSTPFSQTINPSGGEIVVIRNNDNENDSANVTIGTSAASAGDIIFITYDNTNSTGTGNVIVVEGGTGNYESSSIDMGNSNDGDTGLILMYVLGKWVQAAARSSNGS